MGGVGEGDEVCSLRKVCLLDWLIRCLVRVFGGRGDCLEWKLPKVSSAEALVGAPTLLILVMREVEAVGVPCD